MFIFCTVLACATFVWTIYLLTRIKYAKNVGYFDDRYTYLTGGIYTLILGIIWLAIAISIKNNEEKGSIQSHEEDFNSAIYEYDGF